MGFGLPKRNMILKWFVVRGDGQCGIVSPISIGEADHDFFICFAKSRRDISDNLEKPLKECSVLVMGCGYRYADVLLYSTCAKEVFGIDVIKVFWRDGFVKYFIHNMRMAKSLKDVLRCINMCIKNHLGVKHRYYDRLVTHIGKKVSHKDLNLISYDGHKIPFENNRFDVVVSNAVLEHVKDVRLVIKEMARVSVKNGVNYHLYHNYYSFSGNHKPDALNRRYPWGHLRGLIRTNSNHLNKVRISDVERCYRKYFRDVSIFCVDRDHHKKGIDEEFSWEEAELFEPYREELEKKFFAELLLSRGFLIIAKKKVIPEKDMEIGDQTLNSENAEI